MVLIGFFVFILFCAFAYYYFYSKNYADNQNAIIIRELIQRGAKKTENVSCTISIGLSIKSEPFDIYQTNHSIVLIRSYINLIEQKRLNSQAETYLIIKNEEGFVPSLFSNYINVETFINENNHTIIKGDLYIKAPFSSSKFIYSCKIKVTLPI